MKRILFISILALQLAACLRPGSLRAADPFGLIVERYRGLLVNDTAVSAQFPAVDPANAARWISSLADDGRWPDIDYENRSGGAWATLDHLRRVRVLARALADSKSAIQGDARAGVVVLRALDHWTATRYRNPNWWQNEIGVPQVMRDIVVLLGERPTGAQRDAALAVLHQFVVRPPGEGANTVWSAELALMAAAIERDADALAKASSLIANEITQGGAQGIQEDFSFHQHGARLQQFHYGGFFFKDTVRLSWLLRETPWAFPAEKVGLLADLAQQGNAWMSRGIMTVPGTLDRAASRPGALSWADHRRELTMLAEQLPGRRSALDAQRVAQETGAAAVTGFRAFPRSDFAVAHRPAFSFFLKTISTRTEVTETIQRENRKGRKLNWGDHYVIKAGSDYAELPPVWNWDLLPGVTSSARIDSIQRQAFVGALGDGESGVAAMDYRVGVGGETTLTARKFWASHGDIVMGLIGALHATVADESVRTALDQRPLVGDVTVADATRVAKLAGVAGARSGVRWIHHDGLLYVPIGGGAVTIAAGPVTGSWNEINLNYSTEPVTKSVFLPVLEHGPATEPVSSGFAIMACATPAEVTALAARPSWTVLRNDAGGQAVRFNDGTTMAAFYEAGKFTDPDGREVHVDQPCLVLFSRGQLRVCDPTQQGRTVEVSIDQRRVSLVCPSGGKPSEALRL